MTIVFPILDFYIGIVYYDDITCDSNTFIKMPIWLIIKGIFTMISNMAIFITITRGKKKILLMVTKNTIIIFNIILCIWIIMGAIIFWQDCLYLKPLNVDVYIWFSILFGISYIANLKYALNFGDKINTTPLLDV